MKISKNPKKSLTLIIFAAMMLSYAYVCMTKYCFSSAMVFIVEEGIMTNFQTGLISSAFWLVYAVTQLFGGMIADRWHPERLITVGLLAAGVANVAIYFCYENYILTLAIWMLNAFFQFGVWPSVFKMISSMYSGRALTNAMMVATLASPAGLMMSYAVAAIVPRWQDNFVVSFVGLFAAAVIWLITSHASGDYIKSLNMTEKIKKNESNDRVANVGIGKLIVASGLIFIFGLAFFRAVIEYVKGMVPSMINESYSQVDPSLSTLMTLIPLFCGAAAPVLSNLISKKVENEMKVVSVIFAAVLPISLVTLFLGKVSYWWIITSMALVTFGAGASTFFITTLIATKFNKWGRGATVAGILNAFTAIGNVAASAVMTGIADAFSWKWSLVTMVGLIVLMLVIALIELPIWKQFKRNYYYERENTNE